MFFFRNENLGKLKFLFYFIHFDSQDQNYVKVKKLTNCFYFEYKFIQHKIILYHTDNFIILLAIIAVRKQKFNNLNHRLFLLIFLSMSKHKDPQLSIPHKIL